MDKNSDTIRKDLRRVTFTRDQHRMNIYETNKVVDVHKTPNYADHFTSFTLTCTDSVQNKKHYQTLATQDTLYLLLPNFKRVRVTSFLVEPLLVVGALDISATLLPVTCIFM